MKRPRSEPAGGVSNSPVEVTSSDAAGALVRVRGEADVAGRAYAGGGGCVGVVLITPLV